MFVQAWTCVEHEPNGSSRQENPPEKPGGVGEHPVDSCHLMSFEDWTTSMVGVGFPSG